jgi:hypothetical protein
MLINTILRLELFTTSNPDGSCVGMYLLEGHKSVDFAAAEAFGLLGCGFFILADLSDKYLLAL